MNIFVVDYNPQLAAEYLHDKHIVRMPLETAQMLCSVFPPGDAPYKRTHYNHPCTVWARNAELNYMWLVQHGLALCDEFARRYGHEHASRKIIEWCRDNRWKVSFPRVEMTDFAKAMPDEYKVDDPVESYRRFYRAEKLVGKSGMHHWTNREPPEWLADGLMN